MPITQLDSTEAHIDKSGKPTKDFFNFLKQLKDAFGAAGASLMSLVVGDPTNGNLGNGTINAEQIYEDDKRVFAQGGSASGGLTFSTHDLGTVTTGSVTPNPSDGLKQKLVNNGAFTLTATAEVGDVELLVTNGASAGTITFSGFEKQWTGDPLDTTSGHKFVIFIYGLDGAQACIAKALQ